jgi:hypothetical protein
MQAMLSKENPTVRLESFKVTSMPAREGETRVTDAVHLATLAHSVSPGRTLDPNRSPISDAANAERRLSGICSPGDVALFAGPSKSPAILGAARIIKVQRKMGGAGSGDMTARSLDLRCAENDKLEAFGVAAKVDAHDGTLHL